MTTIRICVAGADGRMGRIIIEETLNWPEIKVVSALTGPDSPNLGKRLGDLSLDPGEIEIMGPTQLEDAVEEAEVYVSFTVPQAEVENLPRVAGLDKRIVVGTTGFNEEQRSKVEVAVKAQVPVVWSPNFGVGVNVLMKLLESSKLFPEDYDFSVLEVHHTGKADAPSGTAKNIGDLLSRIRGLNKIVYGREGASKRGTGELEVASMRLGGVPGIHEVLIAGPYEIIRVEHTALSRRLFAQGALLAVKWIHDIETPGIYSMMDVLSG